MRYEQGGVAGGFQDIAYLEGKAFARIDVQIGEGLVQKQKVRLGCKSAGKGNTLLLSTRQFVRITSFCSFEPDKVQQFRHAPCAFGTIQPAQAKANVFLNSKVGKQCVVLEHHANAAMFRFKLKTCAGQYLAVQYDAAGAQRL